MARNKPSGKKKHLAHALKQAQPVPSWVTAKTKGAVRRTPKRRRWRQTKIKV
jgi:large subunit ribosomal protein L39e